FLWPASGLDDPIEGDEFKYDDSSHDRVPPTPGDLSRCGDTTTGLQARPHASFLFCSVAHPPKREREKDRRKSNSSQGVSARHSIAKHVLSETTSARSRRARH